MRVRGVLLLLGLLVGCGGEPGDPRFEPFTMRQRSIVAVPGFGNDLWVRIGDIERGVITELKVLGPGQKEVLAQKKKATRPMSVSFRFRETDYELRVTDIDWEMFGEDFATFRVRPASSGSKR